MIKNSRPVDGSLSACVCVCVCARGEQERPCLDILISAPAACVAPLLHVAIRDDLFVENMCDLQAAAG